MHAHFILPDFFTLVIFGRVQISSSFSLSSFLSPVISILLGSGIVLRTSTLIHPQSTFLPLGKKKSFTPIKTIVLYILSLVLIWNNNNSLLNYKQAFPRVLYAALPTTNLGRLMDVRDGTSVLYLQDGCA